MSWRTIFGNLAGTQNPISLFDAMFTDVAGMVPIPCTAAGANSIALTPLANAPVLPNYSFMNLFSFIATAKSTALVTANFVNLPSLPVFATDGVTRANFGSVQIGYPYFLMYSAALSGGKGGFYLIQLGQPASAPSGMIAMFFLPAAPPGWIDCDGRNGTPDLRGNFPRGLDTSGLVDPGRTLGSFQFDQVQDHAHSVQEGGGDFFQSGGTFKAENLSLTPTNTGNPTTGKHGAETRPRNVALRFCMKL